MTTSSLLGCLLGATVVLAANVSAATQDVAVAVPATSPPPAAPPAVVESVPGSGQLTEITVVASPLSSGAIDVTKVPTMVHVLSSRDLSTDGGPPSVSNALMAQVGSVNVDSTFGNPYQPDISFRGFVASPVVGVPQGFAVYVNGVRTNEAFGDTVNWDLLPDFAIDTLELTSANPVYGLNALGGAVNVQLKDGFHFHGLQVDVSDGSFGRFNAIGEYGARLGEQFAVYAGVDTSHETGWRVASPSDVRKAFADLGYDNGVQTMHLSASYADNVLNGMGPTPPSMLANVWGAGIDYPGQADDTSYTVALRLDDKLGAADRLQTNVYYRHFGQHYFNGTILSAEPCPGSADFCMQAPNGTYDIPLLDQRGNPVPLGALAGVGAGADFPAYDAVSFTTTDTLGAALQDSWQGTLAGLGDVLAVGASLDHSNTSFEALSQFGAFDAGRNVVPTALDVSAAGDLDNVHLNSKTTYTGVYFTDSLDLTPALTLTASGRYNRAVLGLRDELGGDLSGDHRYTRFNPSLGLTYQWSAGLTAFADLAWSNRIPSPAELSCASPTASCSLASFFVADPDLKQVIARTAEAGLRGNWQGEDRSRGSWSISAFRTDNEDDIIQEASALIGRGFFQNDGNTRRQGAEAEVDYHGAHWHLHADYSIIAATFESHLTLESPFNPYASALGTIQVRPGDTLPSVPRQRLKLGLEYTTLDASLIVGANWTYVGPQVLVGDEANLNAPVPGYAVLGLHASYAVSNRLQLYITASNVLDRHYYVSGTYTDVQGLPGVNLVNTTSFVPAAPFGAWLGLRLRL